MAQSDLVSVIIPTHYRNDWLRKAIRSADSQTYGPIEIIVVDDSGEKYAKPIASEYNIKYIAHETNKGVNSAWSTGIDSATGKYIQLLDDDDWIDPEKIEKQVSVIESNPDVKVVYCGIENERGEYITPDESSKGNVLEENLRFNLPPAVTSSMLFDGGVLKQLIPLKNYKASTDMPMKIQAATYGDFDFVDDILVKKGNPDEQLSDGLDFFDSQLQIIKDFEHLYDENEPARRQALAMAYKRRGILLFRTSWWSEKAVISFAKALYHKRFKSVPLLLMLLLSIFGKPAYLIAKQLSRALNIQ